MSGQYFSVGDIQVCASPAAAIVSDLVTAARGGQQRQVHLCNSYTMDLAARDERLKAALCSPAAVNLPDGFPVAMFGRRSGCRGPIRGPQLVRDVMRAGVEHGVRHYLYGGAEGVAERMAARLRDEIPSISIAGASTPPFKAFDAHDAAELAAQVGASGAQILWIGLGTPKQDYMVADAAPHLDMPIIPVGAAFDFIAGDVREAPRFLHRTGLEWAFRLSQQPRRLGRRYLVESPRFVLRTLAGRSR